MFLCEIHWMLIAAMMEAPDGLEAAAGHELEHLGV